MCQFFLEVVLCKADFVGTCLRCGEPSTGSYDSDENDELKMRCVNCGFKMNAKVNDEERTHSFLVTFTG